MDSSSIVKLYIEEAGSLETEAEYLKADRVATSLLAYAEVKATFAAKQRANQITTSVLANITQDFDSTWPHFYALDVSERLVRSAGDLAGTHALSGFDAVHLASALEFRNRSPDAVHFSVADRRLRTAAIAEGFVAV